MNEPKQFQLIVKDEGGGRRLVDLSLGEVGIGRQADCGVCLTARNVSRRHARLVSDGDAVYAEDLASYTGVFVNGDRIASRQALYRGDLLRIGNFELELQGEALSQRREETTQRAIMRPEVSEVAVSEPTQPDVHLSLNAPGPLAISEKSDILDESDGLTPPLGSRLQSGGLQQAQLLCVSPHFAGQMFPLAVSGTIIGRTADNNIGLDHRSVSRQHAKILLVGHRYKVIDLGSANGTLVNGEPYAQAELKRGDLLELGHVKFRFIPAGEAYLPSAEEQAILQGRGRPQGGGWRSLLILGVALGLGGGFAVVQRLLPPSRAVPEAAAPPATAVVVAQAPVSAPPPSVTRPENVDECERLLTQLRGALEARQWHRAESLSNAVLALDGSRAEAQVALQRAEMEARAQAIYESAVTAMERSAWREALTALGTLPRGSLVAESAVTLQGQARAAEVTDRLTAASKALQLENWDEMAAALDEVARLEPERPELEGLRSSLEEGRQRRGGHHPSKAPSAHGRGRSATEEARDLYAEGARALKGGQEVRAIEQLNRCVQVDRGFAACYRALGIAYARSGDGARAARNYRLYLKASPEAEDAAQVRQLLQQYDAAQ